MRKTFARELGAAFAHEDVVRNYRHRPPYPREIFQVLEPLLVAPRVVLDAGCGTGALTRGLAAFAKRVDALDPSEAKIAEARALPGGDDPAIRWIVGRAEDAPLRPPYGLITTGASIHWMDPSMVMPRFRDALATDAFLAIAELEWVLPEEEWRTAIVSLIQRYSPIKHHEDFDGRLRSLEEGGHFEKVGKHCAAPVAYEPSVDEYLAMLASTSSLSRATLKDTRDRFEADARTLFEQHGIGRIRLDVVGVVVWGKPLG
ncbi:MAG TPA: class I SAM-dependent methyltransferase [Candidatus Limnocylindria bacterium]|nr:class I SAM-dependent methyltransferase [Candidatus Limnocylindria bacterium]